MSLPEYRRPRTFVVVPLVLLTMCAVVFSSLESGVPTSLATVQDGALSRTIILPGSAAVQLFDEAEADVMDDVTVRIAKGTALLHGSALIQAWVNGIAAIGWNGGFSVIASADRTTVVALTTPVVLRIRDHWHVLPQGKQTSINPTALSSDELPFDAVPLAYLEQQLPILQHLRRTSVMPVIPKVQFSGLHLPSLQLPKSQERSIEQENQSLLDQLLLALQAEDRSQLRSLLLDPTTVKALRSSAGQRAIPLFIATAHSHGLPRGVFLPFLTTPYVTLLLAFHPVTQSDVLSVAHLSLPPPFLYEVLSHLPESDLLPTALSHNVIDAWSELWESAMTEDQSGEQAFILALPPIVRAIHTMQEQNLPERARFWSTTVRRLLPLVQDSTADPKVYEQELQAVIDDPLSSGFLVAAQASSSSLSMSASSHLAYTMIDVDVFTKELRSRLGALGYMETRETTFNADSEGVRVEGIVIATKNGDCAVNFHAAFEDDRILGINPDGTLLPHAVTLEQFTEWVRGEM